MDVHGLDPDRAARLAVLTAECQSLLSGGAGMDAVQELLSGREVGVIDSIIVTRKLLGAGPGDLGKAKDTVLSNPSRTHERQIHGKLVDELVEAVSELKETSD